MALATPESPTAPAAAAVPAVAPGEGNEGNPRKPALQRSASVDPLQVTNTAQAITPEPVHSAAPPALSLSTAEIDSLLARGKELLKSGDIASARLAFQRVAAAGDRRGAKGVGMTYDPDVYARLRVAGITPDREQAEFWYKKAGENTAFTIDLNSAADAPKAQDPRLSERNAACARKYRSFKPSTGLYTTHSGVKLPCKLP